MNRLAFFAPLALTVVGNVVYHAVQKSLPASAPALLTMALAYAIAALVCVAGYALAPDGGSVWASVAALGWRPLVLGVAVASIELGFLWAYRSGWPISIAAIVSGALVTLALVPIGLLAFAERVNPSTAAGIVLALAGLALVAYGRSVP